MDRFFIFGTEAEAERFCTEGCPIYGQDADGNEVRDKGVTLRLAEWAKHPSEDSWLVRYDASFAKEGVPVADIDKGSVFPDTAVSQMTALGKKK
jgi:hypothetical protein